MSKKQKTIGIFGSIGYDDIGDDALLLSNVDYFLNKGYGLKIFTSNISRTKDVLIKASFLPKNGISNKISVVDSLDYFFSRHSFSRYFDILIDNISDKLSKSKLGVLNSFKVYFLKKKLIKTLKENDSKNLRLRNFVKNIKECSSILFMGGGYFNKHWGSKINQFILALDVAHFLKKPILASGQTFGPLNIIQKKLFKERINYFSIFLVRDVNKSKKRLLEVGFKNEIIEGPDDAIFLKKNPDYKFNSSNSDFRIVINFGGFLRYSKKPVSLVYEEIAKFLDKLIKEKNAKIICISMDTSFSDYSKGIEIQKRMKYFKDVYFVPVGIGAREIKSVISQANLVLSSRLHPVVFAIAEKIPFIAVSTGGEYYNSKLGGISNIYNYREEKHLIDVDDLNLKKLEEIFRKSISDNYGNEAIYIENIKKREEFLRNIGKGNYTNLKF